MNTQRLLSVETIESVRQGLPMPMPDKGFLRFVQSRYNKVSRKLRRMKYRDFDDFLQDALLHYWQACFSYDPSKKYSKGSVGFVSGRVIARLSNSVRTDLRRSDYVGDYPTDKDGNDIDQEDTRSTPIDVQVLLSEVRDIALDALGVSEEYVDSLISSAAGGDRCALKQLRQTIHDDKEDIMSRSLRYVRSHDTALIGVRITHSTVDAGLATYGSSPEEISTKPVLEDKVDWLDRCVDGHIASSGQAFECMIENGRGCGSIIPDLPSCPYCGEDLSEDDGGAEEARRIAAEAVKKTKTRKASNGKRGRPSLGSNFVELFIATAGNFADIEIVERKAYVSAFRKHSGRRDKIAVCVRSTARCHFVIPQVAYGALDEDSQNGTEFYDSEGRKQRHRGRDSVELRGQPTDSQLDTLLRAAWHNAGSALDGPTGDE